MQIKGSTFIVTGAPRAWVKAPCLARRKRSHAVIADLQVDKGEALAKQLGARTAS